MLPRLHTAAAAVSCVHSAAPGAACPGPSSASDRSAGLSLRHSSCPADVCPATSHCRKTTSGHGLCTAASSTAGPDSWTADGGLRPAPNSARNRTVVWTATASSSVCSSRCPGWRGHGVRPDGSGTSRGVWSTTVPAGSRLPAAASAADSRLHGSGSSSSGPPTVTVHHPTAVTAAAGGRVPTSGEWSTGESGGFGAVWSATSQHPTGCWTWTSSGSAARTVRCAECRWVIILLSHSEQIQSPVLVSLMGSIVPRFICWFCRRGNCLFLLIYLSSRFIRIHFLKIYLFCFQSGGRRKWPNQREKCRAQRNDGIGLGWLGYIEWSENSLRSKQG